MEKSDILHNNHQHVMEDGQLTILLTLKDRVPYTIRWMRYVNDMHFPFKILIADGGADKNLVVILSDRTNFPNVNYDYIRYPYDQTYAHYYAKVVDALSHVQTPFVVFADNDDFFVPDGLVNSVEFLLNHTNYSSCGGIIGGVRVAPNDVYSDLSQVYGAKADIFFAAQIYPSGSITQTTASQRVQYYFNNFRTTWYNVSRTEQMLARFRILQGLNITDIILASHVPELLGVVCGPVHRNTDLYLVRQMNSPSSVDRTEILEKGDHFDRMLLESWSSDITNFVNAVAEAVSEKDGIQLEESRRLVRQGYRGYMAPAVIDGLLSQMPSTNRLNMARNAISRFGKAYRLLFSLIGKSPLIGQSMPGRPFVISHSEFKTIYEFLTISPSSIAFR